MKLFRQCICKLQDRKAQILLPSVLLAPIFILVIYLLFETAKVSMYKIRNQFALDNAAVSQMSAASTYLNAVAMVNGPLPYRVMETEDKQLNQKHHNGQTITVFELFYKGGGVPSLAGADSSGVASRPAPESTDWGVHYYDGAEMEESRKDWMKENPSVPTDLVSVMSKKLVENYYFPATGIGVAAIIRYLETYARVGSIYKSQTYVYEELSRNAIMFREAYFLNVNDCKRSECARQSASTIRRYTTLKTVPFELEKIQFFVSDSNSKEEYHGGAYDIPFNASEVLNGEQLFQFAFLNSSSIGKLRALSRGILLKQPYKLPLNHFNINLEQKYKPYVRNRVKLVCPRADNNCVWPHPLPKYGISLAP